MWLECEHMIRNHEQYLKHAIFWSSIWWACLNKKLPCSLEPFTAEQVTHSCLFHLLLHSETPLYISHTFAWILFLPARVSLLPPLSSLAALWGDFSDQSRRLGLAGVLSLTFRRLRIWAERPLAASRPAERSAMTYTSAGTHPLPSASKGVRKAEALSSMRLFLHGQFR